jgi:hypothetical protein
VEVAIVVVHHTLVEAIVVVEAWVVAIVVVWAVAIVAEWEEEVSVDDKKPLLYYFWLVFYFIKNLPQIICLYLYREYLYLKLIIVELFDL